MDNNYNQDNGYNSNSNGTYNPNNGNYYQGNGYNPNNGGYNNPYMAPNQGSPYGQPQKPEKGCGFGIAALIIGILSMTLCCVGGSLFGIIGIILGIVALCRKESKYGLAIGGIVTSIFGVLIGIYMLMCVIFAGLAYDEIKDMDERELEQWLEERLEEIENGNFDGFDGTAGTTSENPFEDHSFQCGDSSAVYFYDDGSYLWYQDDSDHNDNYYSGTYDVYMGSAAQKYITEDLADLGVTEQELEDYYERNSDSDFYTKENLCCLILHNEYFVGEDSSEFEPHDTYYMGYMDDGYYDAANMQSGNYAAFVQLD